MVSEAMTMPHRAASTPTVAIALGGGGARGLGHIAALEALDELGVAPAAIAGTSIGAVIGAGYAAGMRGADIRAFALGALRNRTELMRKLMRAGRALLRSRLARARQSGAARRRNLPR